MPMTPPSRARRLAAAALAVLAIGAFSACSDDEDEEEEGDASAVESGADDAGAAEAITIDDFAFSPAELGVEAGAEVEVTNDDDAAHTWTADDGTFDSGNLESGDSFRHTFDEAGTFAFHCELHPSMKGTVVVG